MDNVLRKKMMHHLPQPSSLWPSESVKEEIRDSQSSRSGGRGSEQGAEDVDGPRVPREGIPKK